MFNFKRHKEEEILVFATSLSVMMTNVMRLVKGPIDKLGLITLVAAFLYMIGMGTIFGCNTDHRGRTIHRATIPHYRTKKDLCSAFVGVMIVFVSFMVLYRMPIVSFMIFGNIARFKVLDAIELLEEKKD